MRRGTSGHIRGQHSHWSTIATSDSTQIYEGTNHASRRITPATIDLYADPDGSHVQRLVNAAWLLGKAEGWDSLIH